MRESGLTRPGLWARCIAIGGALLIGFLAWFGWAYPGMPHGIPIGTMVLGLLAIPAMLAVQIGLMLLVPTRISVSTKRVHISHGNSGFIIKPDQLISTAIEFDEQERPLLMVSYRMRPLRRRSPGREKTRVIAIGPKVDLARLDELLAALMAERPSVGREGAPVGVVG